MNESHMMDDLEKKAAEIGQDSGPVIPSEAELPKPQKTMMYIPKGQTAGEESTPKKTELEKAVALDPVEPVENIQQAKAEDPSPADQSDKTNQNALSNKEVTDHTAGLWKYLPVPENEPDPVPEYLTTNKSYTGSRVVAARVRGKKHKHEGSNCDDWFESSYFEDITFIAVSDGAGSKKFSRIGARESCKAAVSNLVSEFSNLLADSPGFRNDLQLALTDEKCANACRKIAELVQHSVMKAREAVEYAFYSRAKDPAYSDLLHRDLELGDLSGTFLVAVIIPIRRETKEHLIVTCQIGDGMTAVVNSNGEFQSAIKLLGVPDSGKFTGETEFLTAPKMKRMDELKKRTKLFLGPADFVMMMSDGVADDYYPNETQMCRLYFDLIANGILHLESERENLTELGAEQMSLFKKIPDPIAYPWVNDKSVLVPIHYTNRICEKMNLTLEELWEKREILMLAYLELKGKVNRANDAERLCQWLDNYYERGSFDDRALVVVEL